MTKKQLRSRLRDFQGVRSEKGKPRKDKVRSRMRVFGRTYIRDEDGKYQIEDPHYL